MATDDQDAPRPALRRSPDSGVHPALDPRHTAAPSGPRTGQRTSASPLRAVPPTKQPDTKRSAKKGAVKGAVKGDLRGGGGATSDTLRPSKGKKAKKDKMVEITVSIPKSTKKTLKLRAKEYDTSPEELAAILLRNQLGE